MSDWKRQAEELAEAWARPRCEGSGYAQWFHMMQAEIETFLAGFTACHERMSAEVEELKRIAQVYLMNRQWIAQAKERLRVYEEALEKIIEEGIDTSTDGGLRLVREALSRGRGER